VEYTFEVDEKLNSIALPMQVRKNFYLVFKEAITNVVKYSEASRVSISLYEKNKIIMLRIRDNGKGIPCKCTNIGKWFDEYDPKGKGDQCELNIISANDGGTEIELMLKT
jgi:glucose-6-phosphate-specific signal transduction histidine kinase